MAQQYEHDVDFKKRIVWYGEPKTWKTGGLATIPKGCKLYLVDIDRQLGEFWKEWKRRGHPKSNVKVVTVDTSLPDIIEKGEEVANPEIFEQLRRALWTAPPGYDFYAIDCYTTVGLLLTHEIVGRGDERNYNMQTNTDLLSCVTDFFWQFAGAAERNGGWLILTMHQKWQEVNDGMTDPTDWKNKKSILGPDVASSAKVIIPGQCPFVWHVERARRLRGGKNISTSVVRTRGAPFIMAASSGYDDILDETEVLDVGAILKKCKLEAKARKKGRK
jgi:hypothetical protein